MGKATTIEIYARVRPSKKKCPNYKSDLDEQKMFFHVPKDLVVDYINNSKTNFEFQFTKIFEQQTKQDEVFEVVGKPSITSVLDGVNTTCFAYGQTGSGKTFTITGGPERYSDRGIIPRTLTSLYEEIGQRTDRKFEVQISYLEIYHNAGYDLLNDVKETKKMEDLPTVRIWEDENGNIELPGLKRHPANCEEDALNLLFIGDTNRMIAETPMNQASSRSHCIFTIWVSSSAVDGGSTRRTAKFHLVDLAGSERVHKTLAEGQLLKEATSINTSLLFLEQVIIALQERSKHVPYRNSMMTHVLKDSLGGNCRTVMIATVNPENEQVGESISTCRFAQRVALIQNVVMVNETVDSSLIIARLKQQVKELKEELEYYKGGNDDNQLLTQDDKDRCAELVRAYIDNPSEESQLVLGSMTKIKYCFTIFKGTVLDARKGTTKQIEVEGSETIGSAEQQQKIQKLIMQLQQRDNEIKILVSMVKKKKPSSDAMMQTGEDGVNRSVVGRSSEFSSKSKLPLPSTYEDEPIFQATSGEGRHLASAMRQSSETHMLNGMDPEIFNDQAALKDRNKAFDMFRKSYRKNEVIEEHKATLKLKYDEAKKLGEDVNKARNTINHLKAKFQQYRTQKAVESVVNDVDAGEEYDEQEKKMLADMQMHKTKYRESFARLKELKKEIEHLQHLLEQSRLRLQKDFEQWYKIMLKYAATGGPASAGGGGGGGGGATGRSSEGPRSSRSTEGSSARYSVSNGNGNGNAKMDGGGGTPPPAVRSAWGGSHGKQQEPAEVAVAPGKSVPLTGNAEADADIMAFYQLKAKMMGK